MHILVRKLFLLSLVQRQRPLLCYHSLRHQTAQGVAAARFKPFDHRPRNVGVQQGVSVLLQQRDHDAVKRDQFLHCGREPFVYVADFEVGPDYAADLGKRLALVRLALEVGVQPGACDSSRDLVAYALCQLSLAL